LFSKSRLIYIKDCLGHGTIKKKALVVFVADRNGSTSHPSVSKLGDKRHLLSIQMTGIKSSSAYSCSSEKAFLGDEPIPKGCEFAVIIILTSRILFNHSGNFPISYF
jgi:hypothetical protein